MNERMNPQEREMKMTPLQPVERLTKDLRTAAATLSDQEARYMVDAYYTMQDDRMRANNQVRALEGSNEPHLVLNWLAKQSDTLETALKGALDKYTQGHPMGEWMRGTLGIGPVLAAGLLAHINLEPWVCVKSKIKGEKSCKADAPCTPDCRRERIHTVGHIWRFAGLDPTTEWAKGQKRPYNAELKKLCWKVGQSFMKLSGREDCFYGQQYKKRKAYEIERNEAGGNAAAVAKALERVGKTTEAYKHLKEGRLPPAQIDARARRWAVKLFLAHMHEAWYRQKFGEAPPIPYPIAHLGHAHKIEAPARRSEEAED